VRAWTACHVGGATGACLPARVRSCDLITDRFTDADRESIRQIGIDGRGGKGAAAAIRNPSYVLAAGTEGDPTRVQWLPTEPTAITLTMSEPRPSARLLSFRISHSPSTRAATIAWSSFGKRLRKMTSATDLAFGLAGDLADA